MSVYGRNPAFRNSLPGGGMGSEMEEPFNLWSVILKQLPNLKQSVIAISMALVSMSAMAADDTTEPQKVTVTGSNIKRVDTETASPVQVVGHKEIMESGAITVKDILDNLTSNDHSAISDLGGANSWASGASGVSLRNLGLTATLTLLNGRRLSSYGFADGLQANFVNIDSIPANIIDRVEILKDGASAIYGSDAIAGVINIITRKEFQGVALSGSAQQSLKNSKLAKEEVASITRVLVISKRMAITSTDIWKLSIAIRIKTGMFFHYFRTGI